MIKAMKIGVDADITTRVNIALAELTNSMLKVRASTYTMSAGIFRNAHFYILHRHGKYRYSDHKC